MPVRPDPFHDGVPLSLIGDAQVVLEHLGADDVVAEKVEVVVAVVDEAPLVPVRRVTIRSRIFSFFMAISNPDSDPVNSGIVTPLVPVQPHRAQPLRHRLGLPLPLHRGVLHRGQRG